MRGRVNQAKCWIRSRTGTFWFTLAVILILSASAGLSASYWGQLSGPSGDKQSLSETVRNVMLMIGALLALPLAYWRGLVAERQVKATSDSVNAAHTAISNQRFQAAAQMLSNESNAVRLGAIHTLVTLAREDAERYYIASAMLLAAFVRRATNMDDEDAPEIKRGRGRRIREDAGSALDFIASRTAADSLLEREREFKIDLSGASLNRVDLRGVNLSGVILRSANLRGAHLGSVNFTDTDLSNAALGGAYLRNAVLCRTILSGVNFSAFVRDANGEFVELTRPNGPRPAVGLVQSQLDLSLDDGEDPPLLRGVVDTETSDQLLWHGRPPAPEQVVPLIKPPDRRRPRS